MKRIAIALLLVLALAGSCFAQAAKKGEKKAAPAAPAAEKSMGAKKGTKAMTATDDASITAAVKDKFAKSASSRASNAR